MTSPLYRGRFAPSPTGPLHFGSLVAAVASYADARHRRGEWLVRIEDVDETRRQPDAETEILRALKAFGMQSDRTPERQSERKTRYDTALQHLIAQARVFRCNCSRKRLASSAHLGPEGYIYPGTCRQSPPAANTPCAWRIRVDDKETTFDDRVLGRVRQNLADQVGDFVVRRLDGFTAYQLAVVVDDHDQGITDVVRGVDLLWSTPRQVWLQQLLGYSHPRYAHIPLVYGTDGHKLSKRDGAHPIDPDNPVPALSAAWRHLGQVPPPHRIGTSRDFWQWATPQWNTKMVPNNRNVRHERTDTL